MSRQCLICEKKPKMGMTVSHSNHHTKRLWKPNLQKISILVFDKKKNKQVKIKANVCVKCIKANKVLRAI